MILGFMPSMSATAELVVPRSIPITGPLTFSSLSIFSEYDLLNDELMEVLYAEERRVEVARGAAWMNALAMSGSHQEGKATYIAHESGGQHG